jgi:hypothetical protein
MSPQPQFQAVGVSGGVEDYVEGECGFVWIFVCFVLCCIGEMMLIC